MQDQKKKNTSLEKAKLLTPQAFKPSDPKKTDEKPIIKVRELKKFFLNGKNVIKALNNVSFDIWKGEFCAIVGTSGSGKSTLLNMLAGLEKPTTGQISILNKNIQLLNENDLVQFRRNHVGFIFQSFNLIKELNALDNIALPLVFQGIPTQSRKKRAKAALKLVGLSSHKNHKPSELSGGQQQRVGIARALVVNPEIIFADEPTGNLDSKTAREVLTFMKELCSKNNQTLIMVTHDDHLAQYADRIFRIIDGKIISVEQGKQQEKDQTANA